MVVVGLVVVGLVVVVVAIIANIFYAFSEPPAIPSI